MVIGSKRRQRAARLGAERIELQGDLLEVGRDGIEPLADRDVVTRCLPRIRVGRCGCVHAGHDPRGPQGDEDDRGEPGHGEDDRRMRRRAVSKENE